MKVWILLGIASAAYAASWLEVSNSRFDIVTDAGEPAARRLVTNLEQFEGAIAHPGVGRIRIYLFRSETEFSAFRDRSTVVGITLSSTRSAPVILVFDDAHTREVAVHEYFHALVKRGDWKLPEWMEEGMAEFYAYSAPAGKDRLALGRPAPAHLALLREKGIDVSTFKEGPDGPNPARFYAASWALVHLLFMEPRYRPMFDEFATMSFDDPRFVAAIREVPAHLAQPIWKEETVYAPSTAATGLTVSPLASVDAEWMLADLLLDSGKLEAARARYRNLGVEGAGMAALASGNTDLAKREFRRATAAGSRRARIRFELASLDQESGMAWPEVKPLLERAAELDSTDYRASYLLGVRAADDGATAEAVLRLRAASLAAPGKADVWHAYALALAQSGNREEARVAARRALRVSSTPEAEEMAKTLVSSLDQPAPVAAGPAYRRKPEVVTSSAWNQPKPDAEVSGHFVELVCDAAAVRMRIESSDGKTVELPIMDSKSVEVVDSAVAPGGTIELKCGIQSRPEVRVGYTTNGKAVLRIEYLR